MTENPNDWRSAVDPTTSRTYWYHRKTRISTWIKPDFIENVDTSKNDNNVDSNQERNNTAKKMSMIIDEKSEHISLKKIIQKIANNSNELLSNEMNKILNHLIIDISDTFYNAHEIISDLIYIIIHSTNIISRQVTLRMLCILTQNHYLTSEQFGTNQSWIILIKFVNKWTDIESSLLLVAFYCNLMIGTTYSLITEDMKWILINRIKDLTGKKDLTINLDLLTYQLFDESNPINFQIQNDNIPIKQPEIKFAVLNEVTIQSYLILVEKGHLLPVVWLLAVFNQFTKSNKLYTHIIEMGYVQVLHLICISNKVNKDWKSKARSQLLIAMSSSPHIQESVLDAFIDFAKDLSEISVPLGPEPIIYEATCHMMNMTQQRVITTSYTKNVDNLIGFISSQKYFDECLENGHCDVLEVISEENVPKYAENWELLNRDIEWIPSSGTRWRLSSILIWTRCPALREIVNEFWEGGGGGLELSIDACDQVLACICRYIHTGYLMPPITLTQQLELLRISYELGMNSLHSSISKILLQKVTMQSVAIIIEFCVLNGYSDLEQSCRSYLVTGLKQSYIKFNNNETNKSLYLRDAIFASLQDVNEVLSEGNLIQSKTPSIKTDTEINIKEVKLLNTPENYIYSNPRGNDNTTNVDTSLLNVEAGLNDMNLDQIKEDNLNYNYLDSVSSDINNKTSLYSQNQNTTMKSGGIYGMLLRENIDEDLTGNSNNKQTVHLSASKIPGRVMGNNKQTFPSSKNKKPTADLKHPSKEKIEASEFLVKYNKSTVSEEYTPTTKRVSNLLANARPTAYKYEEGVSDIPFSSFDISMTSDFDGPQEFAKPMSLAPVRELTAVEKKLERLTRPTKVFGVKNKLDNKVIVIDEDESNDHKTNELCSSNTEVVLTDGNIVQSMKQPNTTLVELKRSVSPSTPSSSRDEHAILGLGTNYSYDNSNTNNDVFNVRGSLTLLKTKTASRRRRSIAEIEDAQNKQQSKEKSESVEMVPETLYENIKEKVQKNILDDNFEDNVKDTKDLLQCPDCSRRFNYEPFQKHIKVCAQVFIKKRKAFDSTQMRVQANPDLLNFLEGSDNNLKKKFNKNSNGIKAINGKINNSVVYDTTFKKNWKEESNKFREAMKAARQVSAAIASGAPLPPPTLSAPDPSLILCPHCSRRFNAKAAERHIPQCQNIIAKPSTLKRGAGLNASKGLNNTTTPAKSRS